MNQTMQQKSDNKSGNSPEINHKSIKSPSREESFSKEPARQDYISHLFSYNSTMEGAETTSERFSSLFNGPGFSHPANSIPRNQTFIQMQQTFGNHYVQRMVEKSRSISQEPGTRIQAKLKIGQPNDIYEEEADRIADQVMRMPEPQESLVQRNSTCPECLEEEEIIQTKPIADQITPLLQRQTELEEEEKKEEEIIQTKPFDAQKIPSLQRQVDEEEEEEEILQTKVQTGKAEEVTPSIDTSIKSIRGGGQPLSESDRSYFEPRFGVDFSQVRVHTNPQAASAAKSLNARAFTIGKDIVFGAGQYSPGISTGKHLLAHELTHILHQNSIVSPKITKPISIVQGDEYDMIQLAPNDKKTSIQLDLISSIRMQLDKIKSPSTLTEASDRWRLIQLWSSFGDSLPKVANDNFNLWKESIRLVPDLKDRVNLEPVLNKFKEEVIGIALSNLDSNEEYVKEEMERCGLSEARDVPLPAPEFIPPEIRDSVPEEQVKQLQDVQRMAIVAKDLKKVKEKLKEVRVGLVGTKFDPDHPPSPDFNNLPIFGEQTFWDVIKSKWDSANELLSLIANSSPTIFVALNAYPFLLDVLAETDPKKEPLTAMRRMRVLLKATLENISNARLSIKDGSVDYHELRPIHAQVLSGKGANSDTNWNSPFYRWVVNDAVKGFERTEFWIKMGLKVAALAALVVAEISTFGGATFLIALGAGLGMAGIPYLMAEEEASEMRVLGSSHVKSNLALVYRGQITAAEAEAEAEKLDLFILGTFVGGGLIFRASQTAMGITIARRTNILQQRYALEIATNAELEKQIVHLRKLIDAKNLDQAAKVLVNIETKLAPSAGTLAKPTSIEGMREGLKFIEASAKRTPPSLTEIIARVETQAESVIRDWVKKNRGYIYFYEDFKSFFPKEEWVILKKYSSSNFGGFYYKGKIFLNPATFGSEKIDVLSSHLVHEVTHRVQDIYGRSMTTYWGEFQAFKMQQRFLRSSPKNLRPPEMEWLWRASDMDIGFHIWQEYGYLKPPGSKTTYEQALREVIDLLITGIGY